MKNDSGLPKLVLEQKGTIPEFWITHDEDAALRDIIGNWAHIALTYDKNLSSPLNFYVNGALNHTPPLTSINGEIVEKWPNHKPIDKHYIKDVRDDLHEYSLPVIMHSHTELVQYCKIHHGWEVLKAYWNHDKDDYDYFVRKHKKF